MPASASASWRFTQVPHFSHIYIWYYKNKMKINEIRMLADRVLSGGSITYEEAVQLAATENVEELYRCANAIREKFRNSEFEMCSIINAKSGKCGEDCKWCSQSVFSKSKITEYEHFPKDEAVKIAVSNRSKGVERISLVTSGRKLNDRQLQEMIGIYAAIRQACDIKLCGSMGLLTYEQLLKLKEVGLSRYHCNLETAPSFFAQLCSTHKFEEKIQTLEAAKRAGLQICSGGIIGMGETMEQRVELAFELKKLGSKSIPVNVLNPIKGTPLENQPPISSRDILTTIAIFRFVNPDADIRFAGGRSVIKNIESEALHAGINASIVGDLLTTAGPCGIDEDKKNFRSEGFNV